MRAELREFSTTSSRSRSSSWLQRFSSSRPGLPTCSIQRGAMPQCGVPPPPAAAVVAVSSHTLCIRQLRRRHWQRTRV
jgi:hypothetical protein